MPPENNPDDARQELDAAAKAFTRADRAKKAAADRLKAAIANGRKAGLKPAELEKRAPWHRNMTVRTLEAAGLTNPQSDSDSDSAD